MPLCIINLTPIRDFYETWSMNKRQNLSARIGKKLVESPLKNRSTSLSQSRFSDTTTWIRTRCDSRLTPPTQHWPECSLKGWRCCLAQIIIIEIPNGITLSMTRTWWQLLWILNIGTTTYTAILGSSNPKRFHVLCLIERTPDSSANKSLPYDFHISLKRSIEPMDGPFDSRRPDYPAGT